MNQYVSIGVIRVTLPAAAPFHAMAGAPQGGAGYTFALPGNQAYNILPGNLYLPAQNSGYTVTYQKS